MALNPLLDNRCYPQLFPGEVITIIYPGIYGSLRLTNNFGSRLPGTLFLTNARLVFVNSDLTKKQYNFALHLNLISNERLIRTNPSVATYEGNIAPYGNYMPAPGVFKFDMMQDPTPIIASLTNFLNQIRRTQPNVQIKNNVAPPLPAADNAFVDPSDPDIIYVLDETKS